MVLFGRMAEVGPAFYYVDEALMAYRTHPDMFSGSTAFRDDVVRAWSSLEVSGREARALRDRRLAEALVSRAGLTLSEGRASDARNDLQVARTAHAPTMHARLLALASSTGPTTSMAMLLARLRGRFEAPGEEATPPPSERLGLLALHTKEFAVRALCPPDRLKAYRKTPFRGEALRSECFAMCCS